ncbi:CoA transferase [Sphingobium sufflavum]|uniref:CaiB/BaiF CoA transferase family protein n=1 Tax=Sphingobium sufflavum TaxID=1129547 RepID=UPI001F16E364|nr:CoA transferase [Sphingobium sufflavum]MCE7798066.1 CoA transferase [Sphingobium sufflavum]
MKDLATQAIKDSECSATMAQSEKKGRGPLDGIRIIDWTVWQQGPVAAAMLGDLGAEVIKVEERERGDGGRAMFQLETTGASPYWEMNNRNKRSFTVDLKSSEGQALVRGLIAKSDVFIQNFRPSVAERVGLGYERLREINPRLIYASASAFGPLGPESKARAYDLLGQARAGLLLRSGEDEEPSMPDGGMADQMGAIMLAYGVLAALMAREKHGIGQKVDTSLFGSMLWLRGLPIARELMRQNGERVPSPMARHMKQQNKHSRLDPGNPLWNTYKCGDGKWLAMATVQSDAHWPAILAALGSPAELAGDQRFNDHISRCENALECVIILDRIFASRTRDEWLAVLVANGDLPVCAINTTEDAAVDPQALVNDYVTTFDHPSYGPMQTPGFVIGLSETPARIHRKAPEFGEHTEELLIELLGKDWEAVTDLRERRVI